jgi:hypothetical protein
MKPTVLDIRTPLGRANEVHTDRCWDAITDHFDFLSVELHRTHDAHPADGILRAKGSRKPVMLIEVKSRSDFDEPFFWSGHKGTWLISNHKIIHNVPIARAMGIPFIGAMHIVESRVVLLKTIWENGVLAPGIEVRNCETRATINGGRKSIDNAFIPMHDAIRLTY